MMQVETKKQSAPMYRNFLLPFTASRMFPWLWLGQLVSMLGSSVTTLILPIVVLSLTGSTTAMGFTMACYMIANVIVLPFAGSIVDRHDRINIMLLSDLIRFLLLLALAVLSFTDTLSMPLLYMLMVFYGLMDGLFQPAYAATRAKVFTPDIRNAANAVSQLGIQTVRLIGPSLGGILIALFSAGVGFSLNALTCTLSFLFLLVLRSRIRTASTASTSITEPLPPRDIPIHQPAAPASLKAKTKKWFEEFMEGVEVLKSHPWLWITILAFSFMNICFVGVISVLIPWLFTIHHGYESQIYGYAVTCSGVGTILAALIFGSRPNWSHRGMIGYGGVLLSGIALLLMSYASTPVSLAILFSFVGFGLMMFGLVWETSMQELVPAAAFGRVASLDMLGSFALLPLGYVLIGWLADEIGGILTLQIFAALGILTVLSILSIPSIRRFQ